MSSRLLRYFPFIRKWAEEIITSIPMRSTQLKHTKSTDKLKGSKSDDCDKERKSTNTPHPPKDPPDDYSPQCCKYKEFEVPQSLSCAIFRPLTNPKEVLGPPAGPSSKEADYKNPEYFVYHRYSFHEMHFQTMKIRKERIECGGTPPDECDETTIKCQNNYKSLDKVCGNKLDPHDDDTLCEAESKSYPKCIKNWKNKEGDDSGGECSERCADEEQTESNDECKIDVNKQNANCMQNVEDDECKEHWERCKKEKTTDDECFESDFNTKNEEKNIKNKNQWKNKKKKEVTQQCSDDCQKDNDPKGNCKKNEKKNDQSKCESKSRKDDPKDDC